VGGEIQLVALTKLFGSVTAVGAVDLTIPQGEFFSLLGPSGCGKTTTLRMIAGFEQPTSGQVLLDGADMAGIPPNRRNVNTVFQSYALFPHMKVFDNVAYGLRRARAGREEIKARVGEVLEQVQLSALASRKPAQLSGGQQQRVALARALVLKPAVLLLDEPLGSLDAKLRRQLQVELKALQEQVGITFLYVTHDQEEAITMSDRIAVMNHGRVEQAATPREMYEEPATAFVADFLGVSNLMDARAAASASGAAALDLGSGIVLEAREAVRARGNVKVVIRPERVRIERAGVTGQNRIPAMVTRSIYLGNGVRVVTHLATGSPLTVLVPSTADDTPANWAPGEPVTCYLPASAIRVLPLEPVAAAAHPPPVPAT
jgi:spermidine/putrescine transport system ATP-binding protein